jgi:hypothetical protein
LIVRRVISSITGSIFRWHEINFIIFVTSVRTFWFDVTEFVFPDIIAASVATSAVSGIFASFKAVGDIRRELDARGVFRAFFVRRTTVCEAVSTRRIGITDGSCGTFI